MNDITQVYHYQVYQQHIVKAYQQSELLSST